MQLLLFGSSLSCKWFIIKRPSQFIANLCQTYRIIYHLSSQFTHRPHPLPRAIFLFLFQRCSLITSAGDFFFYFFSPNRKGVRISWGVRVHNRDDNEHYYYYYYYWLWLGFMSFGARCGKTPIDVAGGGSFVNNH